MANKRSRKNRYRSTQNGPSAEGRRWGVVMLQAMSGAAVIIGMSLLFVFVHDWITQCKYFRADTVAVNGTDRLDPVDIQKAAHIWEGVNILSINLTTVRKRLISEPWIAEANIRRDFPAAITIDIDEHRPLAVIDFGRRFLINTDGEVFKEIEKNRFAELPVIQGIAYPDWHASEDDARSKMFSSAMTVLRLGSRSGSVVPNERIKKIIVDEEIGLTLETEAQAEKIALGYGNYKKKYRRFETICAHMQWPQDTRPFHAIDLKNPDRVVARPAEAAKQTVAGKGGLT